MILPGEELIEERLKEKSYADNDFSQSYEGEEDEENYQRKHPKKRYFWNLAIRTQTKLVLNKRDKKVYRHFKEMLKENYSLGDAIQILSQLEKELHNEMEEDDEDDDEYTDEEYGESQRSTENRKSVNLSEHDQYN